MTLEEALEQWSRRKSIAIVLVTREVLIKRRGKKWFVSLLQEDRPWKSESFRIVGEFTREEVKIRIVDYIFCRSNGSQRVGRQSRKMVMAR